MEIMQHLPDSVVMDMTWFVSHIGSPVHAVRKSMRWTAGAHTTSGAVLLFKDTGKFYIWLCNHRSIMKPNQKIDSALHVLKGAVKRVLNTPLTTSVYAEENDGRLTVEFDGNLTEQQMTEIERLTNEKIQENVPIKMFPMDRAEAEQTFGNDIYDKFPVPSHVQRLTITEIEDWNINCCLGPHVASTAEIGQIKILKYRPRPNRKELEISFEVV